jgi:hypothetical protein
MKCSSCGKKKRKILDSRLSRDGFYVRRRCKCLSCGKRMTTVEARVDSIPGVSVINDIIIINGDFLYRASAALLVAQSALFAAQSACSEALKDLDHTRIKESK